jgi:hypothetical protein
MYPALLATLLLAITLPALAGTAHVHGKGDLDIVVDGPRLTLSLEIPLDALTGFERPPRTDKEKAAWRKMEQALADPAALFRPTPEAACAAIEKKVSLPFGPGAAAGDGHADADAEYVFQCAQPAALKGFTTTIFQRFPRLYRLDVKRSGPSGQGAGRLAPKQTAIAW